MRKIFLGVFFVVAIIELRSLYLGKENDPSNNLQFFILAKELIRYT